MNKIRLPKRSKHGLFTKVLRAHAMLTCVTSTAVAVTATNTVKAARLPS